MTRQHDQDMTVLATLVRLIDAGERASVPFPVEGLTDEQVVESVRRLHRADPPYFVTMSSLAHDYPDWITDITERGMREGGLWPTPEAYLSQLLALLREVERAAPAEQKGFIRKAAEYLGHGGRDVAVGVTQAWLRGEMGLGPG